MRLINTSVNLFMLKTQKLLRGRRGKGTISNLRANHAIILIKKGIVSQVRNASLSIMIIIRLQQGSLNKTGEILNNSAINISLGCQRTCSKNETEIYTTFLPNIRSNDYQLSYKQQILGLTILIKLFDHHIRKNWTRDSHDELS